MLAVVIESAELELAPEALVELLVGLAVLVAHLLELGSDLLLEVLRDETQLSVVLQHLSGYVQRKVRRIDDAPDEVEVVRKDVLALVHDQHTRAVQLQAAREFIRVVLVRYLLRYEQQSVVAHHALYGNRYDLERRHIVLEGVLVELVVLLLRNVGALALP